MWAFVLHVFIFSPSDIQHLYNLPTTPKIVFESNTENQGFQENMYYQIQHNGMNSTVLYNGKELVPPSPPKIGKLWADQNKMFVLICL